MNSDQRTASPLSGTAMFENVRFRESQPVVMKGAHERMSTGIAFLSGEWRESRFRVRLYRFMAESIPLISSVIWTWGRLAAAPGEFTFFRNNNRVENSQARAVLDELFGRINKINFGRTGYEADILPPFFKSLFLDGAILGRMKLYNDLSGIDNFRFFDLSQITMKISPNGDITAVVTNDDGETVYVGPELFHYALDANLANPYGRSILKAIPFVSFVEQQLVDDMRRSTHNAGYHRLHVRIKPPDRKEGEGDEAYVNRANSYFDSTVSMIKDIEPEDNPVTWDDVAIEYIGPQQQGGVRSNNWYLSHRAMIEEICSGTHLAPFLLGYSYNATTNWAQFKYDLVMRQVASVQNAAINFLNWLANIELSLKGFDLTAQWRFDNNFPALAGEITDVKGKEARRVIDLYNAGLVDREAAAAAAARLV